MLPIVNRSAFIVRPREPYMQWAASLEPGPDKVSETLSDHVSVYLAPQDETGEKETPPLEDYFGEIFEEELEAWCLDESQWPQLRDFKTFQKWFEVSGQSLITDLGDEPIYAEE